MNERENLYIVEKILARRKNTTGQFEYKIKWKGWSTSESTWEPRQHLEYVSALVKKFDSNIEKLRKVKMRKKMRVSCKKNNRNDEIIEQKDEKVVKQVVKKVMKIDEAGEKKTQKQQDAKLNETRILAMKTMQSHDLNKQQNSLAKQRQNSKINKPKKRIKKANKLDQRQPMIDQEKEGQKGITKLKKRKRIRKQKKQTKQKKQKKQRKQKKQKESKEQTKQKKQKEQKKVKQKSLETTNNAKSKKPKKQRIRKKRTQLQQTDKNEQHLETQRNTKSYQKIEPIVIDLHPKAHANGHLKPVEQKQEQYDNILQQQSVSNIWRHQQLYSNNVSSINDAISNIQSVPKNRNFTICKAIDQKIEVITTKEKAKRGRKPRSFTTPKLDEKIQKKTGISKTIKMAPFIVTIAQSESRSHISQHLLQKSEPSQNQIDIEVKQVESQQQQQQKQPKSKRRRRKKQRRAHSSACQIAEYKMKPKRIRNKRSFAQIFKDNLQIEEWQQNKIRNKVEIDEPIQVQVLSIEDHLKQLRTNIEYQMYMKQDGQLGVEAHDENCRKCQIDIHELAHQSPAWLKMFYQNYI